jgi:hypothetical protein
MGRQNKFCFFVKRVTHSLLPLTVECIADIPDSFSILVKNRYSVRAEALH